MQKFGMTKLNKYVALVTIALALGCFLILILIILDSLLQINIFDYSVIDDSANMAAPYINLYDLGNDSDGVNAMPMPGVRCPNCAARGVEQ